MDACEAVRVAKKIVPWLPRDNHDWRVALETLIAEVESAHAEVDREVKAQLRELIDQLEEAS